MEAHELRIKNLVELNKETAEELNYLAFEQDSRFVEVVGIETMFIQVNYDGHIEVDLTCIKPIPLTEAWLLKFGFEKVDKKFYKMHVLSYGKICAYKKEDQTFEIELSQKRGYALGFIPNCNKVHQLQNLFYSLTGKELTLAATTPLD